MPLRERRQRTRPSGDPLRPERASMVEAIRAGGAAPGVAGAPSACAAALGRYAARARALGIELEALVAEFRSVFDRSVPRNPADFGHSLRRERLVTQLLAAFQDAPPPQRSR